MARLVPPSVSAANELTAPVLPGRTFAVRSAAWLLFLFPALYTAFLADMAVHEVLGHGVVALLCGGSFRWFEVHLDGVGWAIAESPAHPNIVLAGGVLAEIALGVPLLVGALLDRRGLLRRTTLTVFGTLFLVSASSYGFWNSYFPHAPGDWGRILTAVADPRRRLALVLSFGTLAVAATIAGSVLLFRCLEESLGPFRGWRLVAGIAPFVLGGVALNLAVDWNRPIPGGGRIPQLGSALLQVLVGLMLPLWARASVVAAQISRRRWATAIAAAWASCVAVMMALYWSGAAGTEG